MTHAAPPSLIGDLEAAPLPNGGVGAKTAFLVYRFPWRPTTSSFQIAAEAPLHRAESVWKVAWRRIVLDANAHFDEVSACSFKRSLNPTAMAGHARYC